MDNNSFASFIIWLSFSALTKPLSASNSNQNTVSSASSTTIPSFAMNSAFDPRPTRGSVIGGHAGSGS